MIIFLTIVVWMIGFIVFTSKKIEKAHKEECPIAHDPTTYMGIGIGFIFHLIISLTIGNLLQDFVTN